jgi:hypothetical protein
MTYQTGCGNYWNHIFLDVGVAGEDQPKTTEPSSMQYYGYSGQVLPGETYHLTMVIGRTHIGGSVDGEIEVYGRSYWR